MKQSSRPLKAIMASESTQTQTGRIPLPDRQAYVTDSRDTRKTCTTNLIASLVDYITDLFRSQGKIDAQNSPHTNTTLPDSHTVVEVDCVKQLFELEAENLAREVLCFMPDEHNAADLGRTSYDELQEQWKSECGKCGKGDGSYPEVRRTNAPEPFTKCTLQCICDSCHHGKAAKIQCDTYDFADDYTVSDFLSPRCVTVADCSKILIHQFQYGNENWAVILGTRDDPQEYSIWGKIDGTTKQTVYHDKILLKEVSPLKPPKRSSRRAVNGGDDGDFLPGTGREKKRKDGSIPLNASKRPRTLNRPRSNKGPARKSIEGNTKTRTYTPVSDDEEDLTLSQLKELKRKTVAGPIENDRSPATPVAAKASSSQLAILDIQQSESHDLQKTFSDVQVHVNSQLDSDGLPVICSNATLEACMKGLEAAASKNKAYVFKSMRATINGELMKMGASALPDI